MKRLLLLSMMVVAVISQDSASARTIIKPEHIYQSMPDHLWTDSVIMSDTATVFHLQISRWDSQVIFFSHETCLRDMKGRTYPLRQIISDYGLQPDEPRTYKDIGKDVYGVEFVFPPLPADVTEVDMIDPQLYNQGIFGIRLDGNPLPPFQLPKDVEGRLKEIMAVQHSHYVIRIHHQIHGIRFVHRYCPQATLPSACQLPTSHQSRLYLIRIDEV